MLVIFRMILPYTPTALGGLPSVGTSLQLVTGWGWVGGWMDEE